MDPVREGSRDPGHIRSQRRIVLLVILHQIAPFMIGSGYVGLVSGACFADFGHRRGLRRQGRRRLEDRNAGYVGSCQASPIPIYEPGLDAMLVEELRATSRRAAAFTTDLAGRWRRCGVHRRRHAVAARRRPCRPDLRARRAAEDRPPQASPWSSPSRPCRSAPATRSSGSSRSESGTSADSPSPPTRSSCAKARRSRTSSGPTASSSAPTTNAPREVMSRGLPPAVPQPRADPVHRAAPPS
jgi:hypothetical protein